MWLPWSRSGDGKVEGPSSSISAVASSPSSSSSAAERSQHTQADSSSVDVRPYVPRSEPASSRRSSDREPYDQTADPSISHSDSDSASASGSAGPALATIPTTAFLLGFAAGAYNNASKAGLVFMAENAHRRPDTVQGWFFYNKTKNYKVVLAAGKGGARTGLRLGLWTFAFLALEKGWREVRLWTGVGASQQTIRAQNPASLQKEGAREGLDVYRFVDGALAGSVVASSAALFCELIGGHPLDQIYQVIPPRGRAR
ncbi:hypothetical protein IE81DRAFT_323237 [Ceraceosorus guamensis]|uniref:Uncharacterized protein n=1 Tax=Ceraceosorus guamensis TaxID=1522189 RepID=A0A316W293_9BASI|nr:hypothetical protein IE81DRAFT_323237 [Ceraceosorus guamensis]PWN42681.1 hypothetical protein IE81DRAFT_323237 [Ceraceosorus guamensis]